MKTILKVIYNLDEATAQQMADELDHAIKKGINVNIDINNTPNNKEDIISAFAYQTGRQIENIIKEQTNDLEKSYKVLKAKVLIWYAEHNNEEFAKYFGIQTDYSDKII